MRDRTPTRALENGALRYGVYAEDGSLLRYEYLALEDEPADTRMCWCRASSTKTDRQCTQTPVAWPPDTSARDNRS